MSKGKNIIVACLGLYLSLCLSAQSETKNLLNNSMFDEDINKTGAFEHWQLNPADGWTRKTHIILPPDEIPYIEHKIQGDNYWIMQKNVSVEPDTWYVLTAWYLAEITPGYANNFWFDVVMPGHEPDQQRDARMCGIGEWVKARTFVYSGKNSSVDFAIRVRGYGTICIGPCLMYKMDDSDFRGQCLLDGGFEKGIIGNHPADFYSPGPRCASVTVETDGEPPSGKKLMKINVPGNHSWDVKCGQLIPAKSGDIVDMVFWAKSNLPDQELVIQFFVWAEWAKNEKVYLSTEWKRFHVKIQVPGKSKEESVQLVKLKLFSEDRACILHFDDISVIVESESLQSSQIGLPVKGNNFISNSSFEGGLTGWSYRFIKYVMSDVADNSDVSVGSVGIDTTTAAEGTCSLRIHIPDLGDTQSKDKMGVILGTINSAFFPAYAGAKYTVSFWAKGIPSRSRIKWDIGGYFSPRDKVGWNMGLWTINEKWQRYHVETIMEKVSDTGHVNFYMGFFSPGTYWIDGIQIENGGLTEYEPAGKLEVGGVCPRLYPCYQKGEEPTATVYLCSRLEKEASLELKYTITDWKKRVVDKGSKTVKVPAGKTITQTLPLFSSGYGPFIVRFELRDPAKNITATSPLLYGVFPKPRDIDADKSWFGTHPQRSLGRFSLQGGTLADYFKLMRLSGVRWERSASVGNWSLQEYEQGKRRWMDVYVDAAYQNGIRIMPIMGYHISPRQVPEWVRSDELVSLQPSEVGEAWYEWMKKYPGICYPAIDSWKGFIRATVEHYGNRIDAYEIFNETGGLVPGKYVEFTKAAYEAIKSVNPEIRVVAPGYPCQGIPWDREDNSWIGRVLKEGVYNYIDVYSAHFYPPGLYFVKELETHLYGGDYFEESWLKRMDYLKKTYGTKPVWDTESMFVGAPQLDWMFTPLRYEQTRKWCTALNQAEYFVRWSVIKMSMGVSRLFYHGFDNGPLGASFDFPAFECNYAPRPLATAYAQLAHRLELFTFIKKVAVGKTTSAYLFKVEGKPVIVYWNYAAKEQEKIQVLLNSKDVLVEDMMGNEIQPEVKGAYVSLPLSTSPVYVIGEKISEQQLLRSFEKANLLGQIPGKLVVALGSRNNAPSVLIGLHNWSNSSINGKVKIIQLPEEWQTDIQEAIFTNVPPDGQQVFSVPLKLFASDPEGKSIVLSGEISSSSSIMNLKTVRPVLLARAVKREREVTVDGRITEGEYGKSIPIYVGGEKQPAWSQQGVNPSASAKVRAVWDKKTIYMGIEVTDNFIITTDKNKDLYTGDCVEVYFNTATDTGMFEEKTYSSKHQGKIACAPVQPGKLPARYAIEPDPPADINNISVNKIEIASQKTKTGYTIELKIPVTGIELAQGTVWGFNIGLIDYDGAKEFARCQWFWLGKAPWKNPHEFGFLVLEAND